MKWYGLTGGIGSGKSTVADLLKKQGVPVVDADAISRELTQVGTDIYYEILKSFGNEILNTDASIDRKKLGSVVFSDAKKLQYLETLLHPKIQSRVAQWRREKELAGFSFAVYDVPLLFEKKLQPQFDRIVSVIASEEIQLARVLKRNPNLSREEVLQRMKAQVPNAIKKSQSHEVIENNGTIEQLENQVNLLREKLESAAKTH